MATAGYSGTQLWKKLGIKPSLKILLINPPKDYYSLIVIPIVNQLAKKNEVPDLIHLFVKDEQEFIIEMKNLKAACKQNPGISIWVSWYKKSSGIPTDITEDSIRNYALKNDLVDVKVCAVTDQWSGLKLVVPLTKR